MSKTSKSIVQPGEPRCYLCGSRVNLERHHCMTGVANRPLAEQYGLWIWLCHEHHTGKDGVQYNREKSDGIKRLAQIAFEAKYDHETWMQLFRKSYLHVKIKYEYEMED